MKTSTATALFDCLSQETRLLAFRLLVKAGPSGLAAGELSKSLGIPHNTMSFHLAQLSNTALVQSSKQGRSVIYSANFATMRELLGFMIEDCCSDDVARLQHDPQSGCAHITLANCCPQPHQE